MEDQADSNGPFPQKDAPSRRDGVGSSASSGAKGGSGDGKGARKKRVPVVNRRGPSEVDRVIHELQQVRRRGGRPPPGHSRHHRPDRAGQGVRIHHRLRRRAPLLPPFVGRERRFSGSEGAAGGGVRGSRRPARSPSVQGQACRTCSRFRQRPDSGVPAPSGGNEDAHLAIRPGSLPKWNERAGRRGGQGARPQRPVAEHFRIFVRSPPRDADEGGCE